MATKKIKIVEGNNIDFFVYRRNKEGVHLKYYPSIQEINECFAKIKFPCNFNELEIKQIFANHIEIKQKIEKELM